MWGVVAAAVLATAVAVAALWWFPAAREQRDREWRDAGQRALARVHMPTQFSEFHVLRDARSSFICGPGPSARCFVTAGDPRDNVRAVRDALSAVATAALKQSCGPDGGFAVAPDKCRLVVPVHGSRLQAFVYAHFHLARRHPVRSSDFNGTVLQIVVAPRH